MKNKTEKLTRYTDTTDGTYYEKKEFINSLVNDEGVLFWLNKLKFHIFFDKKPPKDFTWSERGKIDELRYYILDDNQLLVYKRNKELRPLGIKEMSLIFNISESRVRKFINKLIKYNIIKNVIFNDLKYYVFNPIYGMKSKRLSLTTYLWFENEINPYISSWMKEKILKQIKELDI